MRCRIRRAVYTNFVLCFHVANILTFTTLVYGIGIINSSVAKNLSILAFNWAGSWAKLSFVAGLSQNANIFFFASIFINISFAQMSGFCAFERALLVGAYVSFVILLFRKAVFGFGASIRKGVIWT